MNAVDFSYLNDMLNDIEAMMNKSDLGYVNEQLKESGIDI